MFGTQKESLDKPIPSLDPAGFDTVSHSVLFRGDFTALVNAYTLGSSLEGQGNMYCTGPQGASRSRFGHIWATIGYKGFWGGEGNRKQVSSWTVTTRETEFPITYTKANGAPYTVYVGPPQVASAVNPKTGAYWRVRLIDRVYGATLQGVTVGTPTTAPTIPEFKGSLPSNAGKQDWQNLYDPTVNVPTGWVIRDYQVNSQFTVGNVSLYFWTARFEYVDKYSP